MPPPPRAPYFDPKLDAWVLSRYADVVAASQDSRLRPKGDKKGEKASTNQEPPDSVRVQTQRAFSTSQLSEWRSVIERLAFDRITGLKTDRPVDLVSEFAEPWCTDIAMIVTGAAHTDRERLLELARLISAATADPDRPDWKSAAAAAGSKLERRLPSGPIPMAGAAFVGLAQTLPGFLARAWLALFRHPRELCALHANPELMPAAVEELLRYAGVARRMTRIAQASLSLGEAEIAADEVVKLELNSANRDPEAFAEPNRLDLRRGVVRHLAFGTGPHSCAGAPLLRLASQVATSAFVREFHSATVCEPIEWRGGGAFRVPVRLLSRCVGPNQRPF